MCFFHVCVLSELGQLLIRVNAGLTAAVASVGTTTSIDLRTAVVEPTATATQPTAPTVPPTAPATAATVKSTTTIAPASITNDAAVPATQQGAVSAL